MKEGFNVTEDLFLSRKRKLTDATLREIFQNYASDIELRDNLLYHCGLEDNVQPTLAHSKRLRAYLCLSLAEEKGFDIEIITPLACVVELIHNATLIVDDIQDNGIIRCGKTALWKKVGIPKAMNAAFFLAQLSLAYYNLKCKENQYFNYSEHIIKILDNLVSSQQLDIEEKKEMTLPLFEKIAIGKTGALLRLSFLFGLMPFKFEEDKWDEIQEFINHFSCAYQALDDLADINVAKKHAQNYHLDSSNIYYCFFQKKERPIDPNANEKIQIYIKETINKANFSIEKMIENKLLKTNSQLNAMINSICQSM